MRKRIFLLGFLVLPLAGFLGGIFLGIASISQEETGPVIGNVGTFEAAYARWKADAERNGQRTKLVLTLGHFKGLSSELSQARGKALVDLADGSLRVEVVGLPQSQNFEIWLVHNLPGPGRSVKPEAGDRMIRAGALTRQGDNAVLVTHLDREALAGFNLDLMVVTSSGGNPADGGLLYASPNVFQKLYYSESTAQTLVSTRLSDPGDAKGAPSSLLAPFRSLVPALAYAEQGGNGPLADLVARGEKLFFEEKFHGNGRTCGTCHPADNNFTIDPAYIATLPNNDPLFVAEFNSELNSQENGGRHFEVPQLMRQFGLILLNVDGFEDLPNKFVMRGVPHTFAQGLSIAPATFPVPLPEKLQRTGWDGGGAFGSGGTLREFAIGAVTQHFTRTLDRVAGRDFRLPTDAELDALEAFLLSLGRQTELTLSTLSLKDYDANLGNALFNSSSGKCALCHFNAGANHGFALPLGSQNANFAIGVEDAVHPADGLGLPRPRDGGFGTAPRAGGFGDGSFNTPSLVESADTPPFFHNNLVSTIEAAVEFYTSSAFNGSTGGALVGTISLGQVEITQIAAFLRVINALEKLRSAETKLTSALDRTARPQINKLLELAIVDVKNAIRVLREAPSWFKVDGLYPDARAILENVVALCESAESTGNKSKRDASINAAMSGLGQARGEIVN